MRRTNATRRPVRGNRHLFTVLWVGLVLLVGLIGFRYRRHNTAAGRTAAPNEQVESRPSSGSHPSKPVGVRNG